MFRQCYIIFYSGGYCRGGVQEGERGEICVRAVQPHSTVKKVKGDVVCYIILYSGGRCRGGVQ